MRPHWPRLNTGRLFGAGLDVQVNELPLPGYPLAGLPRVAPHIAAATPEASAAMACATATHALDVLLGRPVPPEVCVNPAVLGQAFEGTRR